MVENVREDSTKLGVKTFGDPKVLPDIQINVPEGHTAVVANTAVVTVVDTKDGFAEAVIDRFRILEHVRRRGGSKVPVRTWRKVIVTGSTEAAAAEVDGIFIVAEIG